uniref:Uncharacterized protein n=1 Tax=Graphocephala atropunctata TaxID=36148 RepID=A0A1B6L0L4_9HEMI
MERWDGKVAVVTGAGSGIGKAIAHTLVSHGVTVVGVGRSIEALKKVADHCKGKKGQFFPKAIDINNEVQVVALFHRISAKLGGVHILINCAGVLVDSSLIDGKTVAWRAQLESQIFGLSICSREAIRSMKHSQNEGAIININSTGGHYIPLTPMPPMYTVAKHGITTLTELLRRELAGQKLRVRITSLSPGFVKTEKVAVIPAFKNQPLLELQDVSNAVVFALSAPQHLEISELTLRAHGSDF